MNFREILALASNELKPKTKIFVVLAIVAVLAIAVFGGHAWSTLRIWNLERKTAALREQADNKEAIANAKEKEAEKFRLEAERLEGSLAEIQKLARKQDETIDQFENGDLVRARRSAADARSVRALESTGDELCKRLEELGHGCN